MNLYSVTLVAVSNPAPQHTSRFRLARRFQAKVREVCRGHFERARERRQARVTAAALEHLGPRELRDIGLVRLNVVHPTRYFRLYDHE